MPPKTKAKFGKEIPKKLKKKMAPKEKGNVKAKENKNKSKIGKEKGTASATKTDLVPTTQKSQTTGEELNKNAASERENRKRSSEESLLSANEDIPTKQATPAKKLRLTEINPLEKAIAEVVMEGDGSSESTFIEPSPQSSMESFITNAEKFLELPEISDEEDSQGSKDDELEYLKQKELELTPDFFENFQNVPDVEDVSLDSVVDVAKVKHKAKDQSGRLDLGTFVNPLTGEISSSSKESVKITIEEPKEVVKTKADIPGVEEEDDVEDMEQISIDIPILSDQEAEDEAKKVADEEDTFNQFLELETQGPTVTEEEIDVEALARAEAERQLRAQTIEFVYDLISRAVDKAEYVDPKVILRQNLDKRKLMKELQEKLSLLEVEKRGQQFLNRKCVEYFRRKRSFRPILDDNPKMLHQEIRKYQAAVNNLDKWLIREQEAKSLTENNLQTLNMELNITRQRSEDEISNLQNTLRRALKRENFDKLQVVVENSLAKMQTVRGEIAKVRFQLIQKQHDMATLVEQLRDLEDLGNGLTMRNFETIQTETQALGKKIEERNTELNKLRYRCHGDIHRQAHLKEKQKMLHETINFQRQYLAELQLEKQRLREIVFQLKIERCRLRKESQDISFQSGLLDKPILMKDFDATVEYLEELQERVAQEKIAISELNEKITSVEKSCS
ncbi:coiled-coil domain-containing protein 96-like [Musca domestica]|nr:coiled-coil domain-containing protein 96-like [Musca domestica]